MIKSKKFKILNILLILVLLCIIPFCGRRLENSKADSPITFRGEHIKVAIAMPNDMYGSKGLRAGINYEMLQIFTKEHECTFSAVAATKKENWKDSLKLGKVDLVIMEYRDTTDYTGLKISNAIDNVIWAVSEEKAGAQKDINVWLGTFTESKDYATLRQRFFRSYTPSKRIARNETSKVLSPYDDLIKKYAAKIGWDWRMLAALIYQESKFSINGVSSRNARGLMQVRPSTAMVYGITDLLDPEQNIIAGTKFIGRLTSLYKNEEMEPLEKMKFTLATYNAGEGRIADCRKYAASKEVDSTKWDEVVKIIPDMRDDKILQEDTVKLGKFKGYETIDYVEKVMAIYNDFCMICPE